jgi:DNA replication protein
MAQKRMFDKIITNDDNFLEMPNSTQALYFHLSMNADDDGFVNNWKSIMKITGTKEDDLKILISKSYLIPFDSGILVIKHWRINNYLRGDRYRPTQFQKEFNMLENHENKAYQLKSEWSTIGIPLVNPDKIRIDKNRIEKNREEENSIEGTKMSLKTDKIDKMLLKTDNLSSNDSLAIASPTPTENKKEVFNNFLNIYNEECTNLPKCLKITEKRKVAINKCLKEKINEEVFREICIKANQSDFLIGENDRNWKADFDFVTRSDKAMQVLEGKYENRQKSNNVFYQLGKEEGIF